MDSQSVDQSQNLAQDLARNLARNLERIRAARNFSQSELARRAGLPRSTVSHVESGQGNPSLQNLARIAGVLGVGLDELVSEPRGEQLLIRAADVPVKQRSGGRIRIGKLLPERITGLEIDRMQLAPRSSMRGTPHLPGTKEYLHGLTGEVQVLVAGSLFPVTAGDVLAFAGDQPHSYRNGGDEPAEAISVVVPLPARLRSKP
jgi:transcriptional regulator with XRE-family HTH domain